jgi:hypothetical protein
VAGAASLLGSLIYSRMVPNALHPHLYYLSVEKIRPDVNSTGHGSVLIKHGLI